MKCNCSTSAEKERERWIAPLTSPNNIIYVINNYNMLFPECYICWVYCIRSGKHWTPQKGPRPPEQCSSASNECFYSLADDLHPIARIECLQREHRLHSVVCRYAPAQDAAASDGFRKAWNMYYCRALVYVWLPQLHALPSLLRRDHSTVSLCLGIRNIPSWRRRRLQSLSSNNPLSCKQPSNRIFNYRNHKLYTPSSWPPPSSTTRRGQVTQMCGKACRFVYGGFFMLNR